MTHIPQPIDRCLRSPRSLAFFGLAAALVCATPACKTGAAGSAKDSTTDPAESARRKAKVARRTPKPSPPTSPNDLERQTCRPGLTYRTVTLDEASAVSCKDICSTQMRCMSATYLEPGYKNNSTPRCQLKHGVADKVRGQPGCVSWVNPRAEQHRKRLRAAGFELRSRRIGTELRHIGLDRRDPSVCQKACNNLRKCQSFTYVRPGYEGEQAQCYLNSDKAVPVADKPCCVSGTK